MDPRRDQSSIVLLASFCQLAKNTIHKLNLETYLIGGWLPVMSFDDLCTENSPKFPPVQLSCQSSCLKFQIALQSLRSA